MSGRLLPLLALALLIEAAVGFIPGVTLAPTSRPAFLEIPAWVMRFTAGFAALLGTITGLDALRQRRGAPPVNLFGASVWLYAATLFVGPLSFLLQVGWQFSFYIPATLLMGIGSALLWGAAIVRRDDPENPRLAKSGRTGAILMLCGFLVNFLQELPGMLQSFQWLKTQTVSLFPLISVVYLASRVLEMWSAVDTMRKSPDPAIIRLRMRRVHKLMWGATGCLAGASLLAFVLGFFSREMSYYTFRMLWGNAVALTMFLVTVLAAARRARSWTQGAGA
jgi:hypothetical protein